MIPSVSDSHHSHVNQPATIPGYTDNLSGKLLEIEQIRRVLQPTEDKLLWEVLDAGRLKSHIKVRQNPFLQKLTTGGFCHTAFMKYLVNLLQVHAALEEAQQKLLEVEHLKHFVHVELFRSEAIKRDLQIWEFVAAKESVPWSPSKITLEYVDYIKKTALEDPEKIIGIMYTMYGTIMSGGQTNKKIVNVALEGIRTYMDDIPMGSGVTLYEIVKEKAYSAEEIEAFKMKWHESLCRIQVTRPTGTSIKDFHAKLIDEVTKTFETILEIIVKDVEQDHC